MKRSPAFRNDTSSKVAVLIALGLSAILGLVVIGMAIGAGIKAVL